MANTDSDDNTRILWSVSNRFTVVIYDGISTLINNGYMPYRVVNDNARYFVFGILI